LNALIVGLDGVSMGWGVVADVFRRSQPHSLQNLLPGGFALLHFGHGVVKN
jgi:hypothetical protein